MVTSAPSSCRREFVPACALILFAMIAASCGSLAVTEPARPPTTVPTAGATFSVPTSFAAACGTVSDRVARTAATSATFVLNSPGRSPLKVALTGNAPVDAVVPTGYVCVVLGGGVPFPISGGLIGPYMAGFVPDGTLPATSAQPAPAGFVLPQACAFVAAPILGADSTVWAIDCGAQANHDARGMLGPALTQQGWIQCAMGLGSMSLKKNGAMLAVGESTLTPGEYPHITQFSRMLSPCS
jgi:hypothetical protein